MHHPQLTHEQFSQVAEVVRKQTGIHYKDRGLQYLSSRLRVRLQALRLGAFSDYCRILDNEAAFSAERDSFLSAVTTNETYFFRNARFWQDFKSVALQLAKSATNRATLRVWSAGCSSGAEAYTAAMVLKDTFSDRPDMSIHVLGTDISPDMITRARQGNYDRHAVTNVPPAFRKWFSLGSDCIRLDDQIAGVTEFRLHDLRDSPPVGRFDLVLLRNVLIYFNCDTKRQVLEQVVSGIADDGRLAIGDVDSLLVNPEIRTDLVPLPRYDGWYALPTG